MPKRYKVEATVTWYVMENPDETGWTQKGRAASTKEHGDEQATKRDFNQKKQCIGAEAG